MKTIQKHPTGPFWYAVVWMASPIGLQLKTMSGAAREGVETTADDLNEIKASAYPGFAVDVMGIDFTRFVVEDQP